MSGLNGVNYWERRTVRGRDCRVEIVDRWSDGVVRCGKISGWTYDSPSALTYDVLLDSGEVVANVASVSIKCSEPYCRCERQRT